MKFDLKTWIIVALVLLLAGIILFRRSPPPPDNGKTEYKEKEKQLQSQLAIKDAEINAKDKQSEDTIKYFQAIVGTLNKELKASKTKASQKVAEIPIEAHKQYPQIAEALNAKDEVIQAAEAKADTLQRAYTSQIELNRELKTLIVDKDRISNEMFVACSQQLDKSDRLANKEHKKKTFFKKLAGVLGIIVITETLLLVAP